MERGLEAPLIAVAYPFITEAVEMKLSVISKLRQNANLRYSYTGKQKSKGRPRKYDGKVDFSEVSRLLYVKSLKGHSHRFSSQC